MERKKAYTSDLTDKQWRILGPHIPAERHGGRHRAHEMRDIVNAILYRLKNGCCWEDLPMISHRTRQCMNITGAGR
jgi:transposase